jgi:CHAT domain-containing protein/Tfp pilus assembly protein PilF
MGFSAWRRKPLTAWHWRFRLLTAELLFVQKETQEAFSLLRDAPPLDVPDHDRLQARLVNDLGYAAISQQKYSEARELLDHAYDLACKSSFQDLIAQIRNSRGYLHLALGHPGLGEEDIRASISAAESAGDRYLLASALGSMGYLLLQQHRYDEAIQWSQRSLEIARPSGYNLITASDLTNEGWCYYRLGDFDKAERYISDSEASFEKWGRRESQQTALGNLGSIHFSRQDYKSALGYYQRALATAETFHFEPSQAIWLNNIATTYIEMSDLPAAEPYNRRALELQSRLHIEVVNVWPKLNAAQMAVVKGDYTRAIGIYEEALQAEPTDPDAQWETHAGLAELYSRKGDPVHAQEEYQNAVDILDTSWSALLNNQSKLTFPSRLTRFYHRYVDFLMGQHLDREALDFVESRRARLLAEKMGPQPASGGFQGLAKRSGAVFLSYWLAPEHSYLWVTAPGKSQTFKLGPEASIRDLVDTYSRAILGNRDGASSGKQLYEILIAPALKFLSPGGRVVVVPDGSLHGLNFETLIAPSGRYFIEDTTVEIAPSLRLLGQDRGSASHKQSILLIGDPLQNDLPELQYAGKEIAGIASLYGDGAKVKTKGDAKPEAYRAANPNDYGAIHFAAHAVPNRDSPLDSAVVLSPGKDSSKLYAREVQDIRLSADLVTVSACQSAGARTYPGEGLVGFAWAFLRAGAHNVVASLWDVNDQSTAEFMQQLYERVQRGEPPATALREVKLKFLSFQDARRKPYYWAPFQLYVR